MSAAALRVRDPWTGANDHQITPPTAAGPADVCAGLRIAQTGWATAPLKHRVTVMSRWADRLERSRDTLAAAGSAGTGGCLISGLAPESIVGAVRGWCADAPRVLAAAARSGTSSIMPGISFSTRLVPYPLVGVIRGGDRTGPDSILRFVRKKALMTNAAPPAPLARRSRP